MRVARLTPEKINAELFEEICTLRRMVQNAEGEVAASRQCLAMIVHACGTDGSLTVPWNRASGFNPLSTIVRDEDVIGNVTFRIIEPSKT